MLSSLSHANIIPLHSTFQDKRKVYFVLEYAPNGNLKELINSQGKLSDELAIFYTAEIINALEYLSSKGIVHRDLKVYNFYLN